MTSNDQHSRFSDLYIYESFSGQDLSNATLDGTFESVTFRGTKLCGAVLTGQFVNADFTGADLCGATLKGQFIRADFEGANLKDAIIEGSFESSDFLKSSVSESRRLNGKFSHSRGIQEQTDTPSLPAADTEQ
jgi:uncharacterized protein YjbI with pentapeptide repeats